MTQEEKAKAYDEALKKAKDMLSYKEVRREDMEYLFPELKESEDERIRKDIVTYLKSILSNKKYGDKFIEDWIAWLEKQSDTQKKIDHAYAKGLSDAKKALEKQGEQKSAWSEEVQEEPVSEPNKELAETYLAVFNKKFPILPSLNGKQLADYKNFLNKCQQIFGLKEWGIRPIQSKLFEKLSLLWAAWGAEHLQGVGRQDEKEQDIPVNEELEIAANEWNAKASFTPFYMTLDDNGNPNGVKQDYTTHAESFKAGAKWQIAKLMTNVIDAQCFGFQGAALFSFRLPADNYLVGSEVKVIVIKED